MEFSVFFLFHCVRSFQLFFSFWCFLFTVHCRRTDKYYSCPHCTYIGNIAAANTFIFFFISANRRIDLTSIENENIAEQRSYTRRKNKRSRATIKNEWAKKRERNRHLLEPNRATKAQKTNYSKKTLKCRRIGDNRRVEIFSFHFHGVYVFSVLDRSMVEFFVVVFIFFTHLPHELL